MLFFTFIKGGGASPPWPDPWTLMVFRQSLLTNVNKKMVFLMKASLIQADRTGVVGQRGCRSLHWYQDSIIKLYAILFWSHLFAKDHVRLKLLIIYHTFKYWTTVSTWAVTVGCSISQLGPYYHIPFGAQTVTIYDEIWCKPGGYIQRDRSLPRQLAEDPGYVDTPAGHTRALSLPTNTQQVLQSAEQQKEKKQKKRV